MQERTTEELSRLDKLIAAARELAVEVKERTVAAAQNVAERMEQLRGRFERWREQRTEDKPEQRLETQKGSPSQEMQRAGPELVVDSQIAQGRQAFRERYEAYQQAKEPAVVPEPQAQAVGQELGVEKGPAKELEIEIEHDRGFGIGR